ncbi:hypothetical protein DsansV1_C30g0215401 [Dioscorea sansibarensis]
MYHPIGLDEALSYDRACSRKASTLSCSEREGQPPANFIRTEMITCAMETYSSQGNKISFLLRDCG